MNQSAVVTTTTVLSRKEWILKRKQTLARAVYEQFRGVPDEELLREYVGELYAMVMPKQPQPVESPTIFAKPKKSAAEEKAENILLSISKGIKSAEQIGKETGIARATLYKLLPVLVNSNLIIRRLENQPGTRPKHFYLLSEKGKRMFNQ